MLHCLCCLFSFARSNYVRNHGGRYSHPRLILDSYNAKIQCNEPIDDDLRNLVKLVPSTTASSGVSSGLAPGSITGSSRLAGLLQNRRSLLLTAAGGGGSKKGDSNGGWLDHEQSGKMIVLHRMMSTMRAMKQGERIVVVSNYTMTLDLIETMCEQNHWPVLRLDGTISGTRRTQLVDQFNSPTSGAFAFLLSSKAGGCGINLIGGNRLVL
jgi:SNF2 family DNA or RNA helicase